MTCGFPKTCRRIVSASWAMFLRYTGTVSCELLMLSSQKPRTAQPHAPVGPRMDRCSSVAARACRSPSHRTTVPARASISEVLCGTRRLSAHVKRVFEDLEPAPVVEEKLVVDGDARLPGRERVSTSLRAGRTALTSASSSAIKFSSSMSSPTSTENVEPSSVATVSSTMRACD